MSEVKYIAVGESKKIFNGVELYKAVTKVESNKPNSKIELGKLESGFVRWDESIQNKTFELLDNEIYATANGVRCLCCRINKKDCLVGSSQIMGSCHLLINGKVGEKVFKCNRIPKVGYEYKISFSSTTAAYLTSGDDNNKVKKHVGDESTGYDVIIVELSDEKKVSSDKSTTTKKAE